MEATAKKTPIVWRHHMSGVWIGFLYESDIPGHLCLDGCRVWSWSGGRVDCSSLARQGARQGDKVTGWVQGMHVSLEASVEIQSTTEAIVEASKKVADKWVADNEGGGQ